MTTSSGRKVRTGEEERDREERETSPNRAGVAEPCLKIWDKNLGQNLGQKFGTDGRTDGRTDGQTDGQTDRRTDRQDQI
jgi:hypothetical protein